MIKRPFPNLRIRKWLEALPLSLRAKLILGNLLIVFIALPGMGYYVFYRSQEANLILTQQLEENVRQRAETELSTTGSKQAAEFNSYFVSIREDITKLGGILADFITKESVFGTGAYWDASQLLSQTENQSWDNPNGEVASVFVPAGVEITGPLISEINTLKHSEIIVPPLLAAKPDIVAFYFGGVSKDTIYFPNIDLAAIVPADFDVTSRPWYVISTPENNPLRVVKWTEPYLDEALHGIVVTGSIPVYDSRISFRGVAAMDIQLSRLAQIVTDIKIGDTGYAFIVDSSKRLIAMPQAGYSDFSATEESLTLGQPLTLSASSNVPPDLNNILEGIAATENGLTKQTVLGEERYVVYGSIPEVGYTLVLMVPTQEMLAEAIIARQQVTETTRNAVLISVLLVAAILIAATLAAFTMGTALTAPLKALTNTAEKITKGDLEISTIIPSRDEIGLLSKTLNAMTNSLKEMISSLEQRVSERTSALEIARQQSEKRARDLQTIGEISSVITSEQKIETLLPLITRLVSDKFNFYHVGIFLVDETGRYAVLQAANSEGGQRMLARGHKLEVGVTGLVGNVADSGIPRIALDVGVDAVFFNNPDLLKTRSEIALPLISRGQTIGVLDVQSEVQGAFTEDEKNNLGILADQIASVIENARLFGQTQQSVSEVQSLYKQYLQQEWNAFLEMETVVGYHQALVGGKKLEKPVESEEIRQAVSQGTTIKVIPPGGQEHPSLVIPIKLRGQVIGVLNIKAPAPDRDWTRDELNLAETVSDRLALALENARLIQDSQRRAAKEQVIGEITAKIGTSINMRNVLQTAVEELGRALPGSEVIIDFQTNGQNANE